MSSDIITTIQAVVRDQLQGFRTAELGVVTAIHTHESDADTANYACDVRLRDADLELKRVPVLTHRFGAVAIPNPGDLVVLQFLHGDIHAAVVAGRVYSDEVRPPVAKAREFVYVSPDGAESGIRRLYLEFPNGNTLLLDDDKLVVAMGKTKLTINHDGDVILDAGAKLTIETKGDASLKVTGNLALDATGDLTIGGANVAVRGTSNAVLEGTATTVKGTTVKIAGKTDFSAV